MSASSFKFFPASQDEHILILKDNFNIISFPIIEGMMSDEELKLTLEMDSHSKKRFENARDGQGFSLIQIIEKNAHGKWVSNIDLRIAFNQGDGLPREDKNENPYTRDEYVEAEARVSQSGSGVIHGDAMAQKIREKKIPDSESSFVGRTLGSAIVKGAESREAKDYIIKTIKSGSPEAAMLKQNFKDRSIASIAEYEEKKKYLILVEGEKSDIYEVYYILNQKLVHTATLKSHSTITIRKSDIEKDGAIDHQLIVDASLKTMRLDKSFSVNTKSASQNNQSVFYDIDFESYVMYMDPGKYLFDDKKKLAPEGPEWGCDYDLRRSVPLFLIPALYKKLSDTLDVKVPFTESNKQNLSSWSHRKHEDIILEFKTATNEQKLLAFADNIHMNLRLHELTIQAIASACKMCKAVNQLSSNEEKYQMIEEWYKNNESFRECLQKIGSIYSVQNFIFARYLKDLQQRLSQLVVSYNRMKKKVSSYKDAKLNEHIPKKFDGIPEDKRTVKDMLISCNTIYDLTLKHIPHFNTSRFQRLGLPVVESTIMEGPSIIDYKKKLLQNARILCNEKDQKSTTMNTFNQLIRQAHLLYDTTEVKQELKKLLQIINHNGITSLENAAQNKWYDIATMILFYSDVNLGLYDKICHILKENIPAITQIDYDLDDFLCAFLKRAFQQYKDYFNPTDLSLTSYQLIHSIREKQPLLLKTNELLNQIMSKPAETPALTSGSTK